MTGRYLGSGRARETTEEDNSGEFFRQTGMRWRTCRDTIHAYREGDIFGHGIDKA